MLMSDGYAENVGPKKKGYAYWFPELNEAAGKTKRRRKREKEKEKEREIPGFLGKASNKT